MSQEIHFIPFDAISVDFDRNCRVNYENIVELARDIAQHGMLTPLTVVQSGKGKKASFELVAGFRRYKALELLRNPTEFVDENWGSEDAEEDGEEFEGEDPLLRGYDTEQIPALVTDYQEQERDIVNIKENLSRDDVKVWELGGACKRLRDVHKMKGGQIARELSYNRNYVNFAIKVASLPAEILKDLRSGKVKGDVTGLLKGVCYGKEFKNEKGEIDNGLALERWREYKEGLREPQGDGGKGGKGAKPKKPPSKAEIEEMAGWANDWLKAEQEEYEVEFLKGVKMALTWVTGKRKRAPLVAMADEEEEEVAAE